MNIKIFTAGKDDWLTLQKLNNEVFEHDSEFDNDLDLTYPFSKAGIKYYKDLANGTYGHCFIAYINSEPVGYVAMSIKDFGYRKSKYTEIENIGVTPPFRSHGIGNLLMKEVTKWAKDNKTTKLYVSAYSKNSEAIKFYKKNGFVEIGLELDKEI